MKLLRRISLSARSRLVKFGLDPGSPEGRVKERDPSYSNRVEREIEHYKSVENVHDLPEIFHFWSNKYLRPKVEEVFGVSGIDDFYAKYIFQFRADHPDQLLEIVSLGAGNSDSEIRIAKFLRDRGLTNFRFQCLDINPNMLQRGREAAVEEHLAGEFEFLEEDVGHWQPARPVAIVMAHHSLHHMVALEEVFSSVKVAIGKDGYFLTCDMVGRNGHMRWPEALEIIQGIWQTMPDRYKYNHQLKRFEQMFVNWDCSQEGFEGVRAQDILPLLVRNFYFEGIVAFGNLPDIFVDRSFGHNFDPQNPEDIEFIDRIAALNDRLIDEEVIKPTQIIAALRGRPTRSLRCYRHWTPDYCIRHVTEKVLREEGAS